MPDPGSSFLYGIFMFIFVDLLTLNRRKIFSKKMCRVVQLALVVRYQFVEASVLVAAAYSGEDTGFSSAVETVIAEGTMGLIVHNAASNSPYFEYAPESRLTSVTATYHQSILLTAGQRHDQPFKLFVTCLRKS